MNPEDNRPTEIDAHVRAGLRALTEVVLPGTDVLPPGVDVGAHHELLDRALRANPGLSPAVLELGRRAAHAGTVSLDDLLAWPADLSEDLVFALTAAYYMATRVRQALGYPGQVRRPVADATADERVSEDLLAPVIARGPIFVPTPEGATETDHESGQSRPEEALR
jgi:hypothetical protein